MRRLTTWSLFSSLALFAALTGCDPAATTDPAVDPVEPGAMAPADPAPGGMGGEMGGATDPAAGADMTSPDPAATPAEAVAAPEVTPPAEEAKPES